MRPAGVKKFFFLIFSFIILFSCRGPELELEFDWSATDPVERIAIGTAKDQNTSFVLFRFPSVVYIDSDALFDPIIDAIIGGKVMPVRLIYSSEGIQPDIIEGKKYALCVNGIKCIGCFEVTADDRVLFPNETETTLKEFRKQIGKPLPDFFGFNAPIRPPDPSETVFPGNGK